MRYAILLIVLTTSLAVSAQEFQQAMKAMQASYIGADDLQIVMSVAVYDQQGAARPYYTMHVDIKKAHDNYHYRFGDSEMLLNDKYFILVDRSAREMVVQTRDVAAQRQFHKTMQFDLDSILVQYQDAQLVETKAGIQHFRIQEKKGSIQYVDMYINEATKFLSRMTYVYTSKQFVSVVFERFDKAPEFPEGTFDDTRYVVAKGEGFAPASGFKPYKLIVPPTNNQ